MSTIQEDVSSFLLISAGELPLTSGCATISGLGKYELGTPKKKWLVETL